MPLPPDLPEKWVVDCKSVGNGEKTLVYPELSPAMAAVFSTATSTSSKAATWLPLNTAIWSLVSALTWAVVSAAISAVVSAAISAVVIAANCAVVNADAAVVGVVVCDVLDGEPSISGLDSLWSRVAV